MPWWDSWGSRVWGGAVGEGLSEEMSSEVDLKNQEPARPKVGQRWSRDQFSSCKGPEAEGEEEEAPGPPSPIYSCYRSLGSVFAFPLVDQRGCEIGI